MGQIIKQGWGEDDIPPQHGRTILITGASNGLGFEAARMLAARGASVLMACRSAERGETARQAILALHRDASLQVVPLDLADLRSVAAMPKALQDRGVSRIDVLLNNAGLMMPPRRRTTAQGFEVQFGTNHLGHFALTRALFSMLAGDGRIVSVASIADRRGGMNWDDLQWEKSYHPQQSYGQSKTANLLFIKELTRRLAEAGSSVLAVAAHPGVSMTNLATGSVFGRWLWLLRPLVALGLGPKVQPAAIGALPEVYAAAGEIEPGAYYGPAQRIAGHPQRAEGHRAAHSDDAEAARRLWEISEALTGARFTISPPG